MRSRQNSFFKCKSCWHVMFHWPLKGNILVFPAWRKQKGWLSITFLSPSVCVCVHFKFPSIWQIFTRVGVNIIQFGNTPTALLYCSLQLVTKWRICEIVRPERHKRHILWGAEIKRGNTPRKNSNFCWSVIFVECKQGSGSEKNFFICRFGYWSFRIRYVTSGTKANHKHAYVLYMKYCLLAKS